MPRYHYLCADCEQRAATIKGASLTNDELLEVVFETMHQMFPTDAELAEARICPCCNSQNTEKTMLGTNIVCYVRGNGYLDKAGCHRDMNLHKLMTDDPYAGMREPGEANDLADRLRKSGQHNPHPLHFTT